MTTHLVTFASSDMSRAAKLCVESAEHHGVDSVTRYEPHNLLRFISEPELKQQRGCGHWWWKPHIILDALTSTHINFESRTNEYPEYVIYSDAGIELIDNVNHIIDRMDQDIFLFGNQWEHAHWCKADIVAEIMPEWWYLGTPFKQASGDIIKSPSPWARFGKQVQASVIFFRVNDTTRAFVKEWLNWCLFEGGRLIDDSPSRTPNHPEFRENRHDQAILTTMAYRDGIKLHWWPAMYNDGAFIYERGDYPDEGYPVLFHHHRKRNHEWEQVA